MRAIPFDQRYIVNPDTSCWEWVGPLTRGGYGTFRLEGRRLNAHRASYLMHVGPADGLDIDHLCRVRKCVNPAHLEAVTRAENLRRGF